MNALEHLLQDDLNRLVDRIATSVGSDIAAGCGELRPDLLAQLADSETRLSATREGLLRSYVEWLSELDECEDLWGLANLAAGSPVASDRRAA